MIYTSKRSSSTWIWVAFWVLFVLHQDVWFWGDRTLVLGVVPIGLVYHVCFSFAAAGLWLAATRLAWPAHIEAWADEHVGGDGVAPGKGPAA
jgi:hypothetical protein